MISLIFTDDEFSNLMNSIKKINGILSALSFEEWITGKNYSSESARENLTSMVDMIENAANRTLKINSILSDSTKTVTYLANN